MLWRSMLLLCVLAASCGDRAPRGLWSDPALEPSALAQGVVIGGVVDLTSERDLFGMQKDAEILERMFAAERPSISITAWPDTRTAIETDSLDAVLAAYRLTGRLSARQMQAVAPLADRGRYLALVRIDLDQTRWDYTRRTRQSGDRTIVDVDPESRREMALLFDLYDLQLERLVFTVPVRRTGIEHGSVYSVEGMNAIPTEAEVQDAIEDLDSTSDRPEPADRSALLQGMFRDAVKYLPG